ncbi:MULTISPECIES: hypothetical protein [Methanobacterium]|uniref:Uncharacterized protein n=1 Tax=Methanobacterium veterum TaxID=408577 RepID=A0A9E5A6Q7_9EURY|nr:MULTISPECIES: hypothetical protein [Methanobacterium]MCZ3367505.1 hypothetical protein [Methanobacterium veterum]MCZ3373347.1 hypothetical protein [Methanobacterium veterum]
MNQKKLIIVIALVAVIVLGALAATTIMKPQGQQVTAAGDSATKLAFYNNGTTWLHLDVVMENVTLKNGTVQNFYAQIFLKPHNGTAIIDLSNLAGYGDKKLPAGTKITILASKGLFMPANSPAVGSTANLNLSMQGWSNTREPSADDALYNIFYPHLNISQLPTISGAPITNDTVILKTKDNEVQFTPEITNKQDPLFEHETLSVDKNGKVTITIVQKPTLQIPTSNVYQNGANSNGKITVTKNGKTYIIIIIPVPPLCSIMAHE